LPKVDDCRALCPRGGIFDSSISPVAIFATMTAAPITSVARFSPLGPLGILPLCLDDHLVKLPKGAL
jgi:hypothetical protein